MGKAKNVFMGIIWTAFAVATFIIMPYIGLTVIKSLDLSSLGVSIDYLREASDKIMFYVISFGIVQAGLAFAKGSSPSNTKRKALFSFLYVLGGGLYTYVIKFSGLSTIPIELFGVGEITVSFNTLIYMTFGIIMLNSILTLFDIFIVIYEQNKGILIPVDGEGEEIIREEESEIVATVDGAEGLDATELEGVNKLDSEASKSISAYEELDEQFDPTSGGEFE